MMQYGKTLEQIAAAYESTEKEILETGVPGVMQQTAG